MTGQVDGIASTHRGSVTPRWGFAVIPDPVTQGCALGFRITTLWACEKLALRELCDFAYNAVKGLLRMETSLHRQLKALYAPEAERQEIVLDGYRIDAVDEGELIEIQQGSLGAIRAKVKRLLERHRVRVVKPLAARTLLIRRDRKTGKDISRRYSPRHDSFATLFLDFVHFGDVFPHPRLTLEVVLVEQEEIRVPVRRRWFRAKDYRTQDRRLIAIQDRRILRTTADLLALLPCAPWHITTDGLFTTADLSTACGVQRWLAQKMAYCLRKVGVFVLEGKRGNSWLYRVDVEQQAEAA